MSFSTAPSFRAGRAVSWLAGLLGPAVFSLRFKKLGSGPLGLHYPSLSQSLRSYWALCALKQKTL